MRGSISGKSGTGERAWVYQPDYLGTVRYVTKIQCPFVLLLRDPHSPRMSFRNNADLGKGVPRGMFNMVPGTPLFFLFGKRPGHRFSRLQVRPAKCSRRSNGHRHFSRGCASNVGTCDVGPGQRVPTSWDDPPGRIRISRAGWQCRGEFQRACSVAGDSELVSSGRCFSRTASTIHVAEYGLHPGKRAGGRRRCDRCCRPSSA